MLNFKSFLKESSSIDDEKLGHLTHTKDIPHEDPSKSRDAVKLLHDFHNIRRGKSDGDTKATLKTDGGASVHIIHDDKGVGVSDKHRFARGVIARTPEEVDTHFGHAPSYAAALKHVLKHGKEFVNKGHHVQGDLLHTPAEKVNQSGGHTTVTPNRITYKAKTKAPLGIAVHTEVKHGVAQALSKTALKKSPNVFVPEHEYHADPSTYSREDRAGTEHHLAAAEKLLKDHTAEHLTSAHQKHFTTYLNRTTKTGTTPSVDGYKKHLSDIGKKESDKLKTSASKAKKTNEYASHIDHVEKNKEHFQRSIDIRHHLGQATEHLLHGIHHPDMQTSIDNKKSPGEGIVLQKHGRPVSKLVPVAVSNKILNNTRFAQKA